MNPNKPTPGPDERSCVWVSAGVLSYYICTRNFRCEDCPLQEALSPRGAKSAPTDLAWPHDRLYADGHLWVQRVTEREAKVGLTALAAQILYPVSQWDFGNDHVHKSAGQTLVAATTRGGKVHISLPFDVTAVAFNDRMHIDPLWPLADPWDYGFLAVVEVDDWSRVESACESLKSVGAGIRDVRTLIHDELTAAGHHTRGEVRAADGGLPAEGLAAAVGVERYRGILATVFGHAPSEGA